MDYDVEKMCYTYAQRSVCAYVALMLKSCKMIKGGLSSSLEAFPA